MALFRRSGADFFLDFFYFLFFKVGRFRFLCWQGIDEDIRKIDEYLPSRRDLLLQSIDRRFEFGNLDLLRYIQCCT